MPSYSPSDRRGRSSRRHGDRYDDYDDYYDDGYDDDGYNVYDERDGRGRSRHRHRSSHARSASSSRRSSARSSARSSSLPALFGDDRDRELRHVVAAALTAGAVEAFRLRKSPGKWAGDKGGRVATAAIGAAVADTAVERNNRDGKHARRHVIESTVAGLLADRVLNGKRRK